MDAQADLKFAEMLVRGRRQGVAWEQKKLRWIREEKAKQERAETEAA